MDICAEIKGYLISNTQKPKASVRNFCLSSFIY